MSDIATEQLSANDTRVPSALISLGILMHIYKLPVNLDKVKHQYCPNSFDLDELSFLRVLKELDLKAKITKIKSERLNNVSFPAVGISENYGYFILGKEVDGGFLIQKAGESPEIVTAEELFTFWDGKAILVKQKSSLIKDIKKFDISWFLPVIAKYKKLFGEVILASLFIQLFALVTPLMFQVVMDKVLVHQGVTTLNVIVIALVVMACFDVILNGLRNYVFSHTTSRVDVSLGAKLFDHLMRLPIAYFQSRPVGQIVARVRELETIRGFITGNALTSVLDLLFTFVFFAVMFYYSVELTLIVLCSIPVYAAISILITPTLRARTEEKFQRGAVNQAFLTESLSGMETIKSMAVEPQMRQKWERQLAGYVRASFRSVTISNTGSQGIQLVSKIVTALLLWKGAHLVMAGELTVGQLIAFNMLSGQVAQPIIRLSQLWQDFQQFKISLDRLSDVLNMPAEPIIGAGKPPLPKMEGKISIENVVFRYAPGLPEVLRNVSLDIPSGQVVGIVGTSGSGKSTLTKLIQRLYLPELGKVSVDGVDLSLADPAWLRSQIGVVLQDNILFDASVRENIALSNPATPMDKVIEAAKLSGAHEFISGLPEAYDTRLGERGSNLSGGQRQRIAIARALINNPRILIFDEATSALDYESEKAIQDNMAYICRDRTVIIIAHRLSAVRSADRIIAMENGQVIEDGSHEELMNNSQGRYRRLVKMQQMVSGDSEVTS